MNETKSDSVEITREEAGPLLLELFENYPEFGAGMVLRCTSWKYKEGRYTFLDIEENKTYKVDLTAEKSIETFLKWVKEVQLGTRQPYGMRADKASLLDGGSYDQGSVDSILQHIIFGEDVYG